MTDIDTSMRSITDPARYEAQLSAFDLTDAQKADLVQILHALAIEIIEAEPVDKHNTDSLTRSFNLSNLL